MNSATPEFVAEAKRLAQLALRHVGDTTHTNETTGSQHRFRTAHIVFNANSTHPLGWDVVELYDEVLRQVAQELKAGYVPQALSMEQFDHQCRDWLTAKIESFFQGSHPWLPQLQENPERVIFFEFTYGSVPSEGGKELGLLPSAEVRLIEYRAGDDNDTGEELQVQKWTVWENAVNPDPEILKQFGREVPPKA